MTIHELKSMFLQKRGFQTDNPEELMNFVKTSYIQNEISIKDYRLLVRELEELGVKNQEESTSLIELQ